jgi:hypothetical protein
MMLKAASDELDYPLQCATNLGKRNELSLEEIGEVQNKTAGHNCRQNSSNILYG